VDTCDWVEVTARAHGYAYWEMKRVDDRWVPVQHVAHLRRLRDQMYVLQDGWQPLGRGSSGPGGYFYALLRIDSAERVSVALATLDDRDAKFGVLSGDVKGRNLTVSTRDHLTALMKEHLDSEQSIKWTQLMIVPLPVTGAAAAGGARRSPAGLKRVPDSR
jgi:hypothetical protein